MVYLQQLILYMSCINLYNQFISHVEFNPHQSSYWNAPTFMKSCNEALSQVQTLKAKMKEFQTMITKNRLRHNQDQQSKMLHNLKENIRICENHLKRLQAMTPDMKTTKHKFLQEYKESIIATLEMKILEAGLKFKNIYEQSRKKPQKSSHNNLSSQQTRSQSSAPNLNRPLFIDQTQQQLLEEVSTNEYRGIEKSIAKISEMYQQTASIVRMHQFMIDSIQNDINQTEAHVQGGRKHLVDAHRRQSKNRPFILKFFAMLYIVSGVYIILLS